MREIACDESGYEGDRLVGGVTSVFAHAGVDLGPAVAAACLAELRHRIRSPALEYKANHLLRGKHRDTLRWLFGVSGPVHGHAHVHVVDKAGFSGTDLLVPALREAVLIWGEITTPARKSGHAAGDPPCTPGCRRAHVRTAAR